MGQYPDGQSCKYPQEILANWVQQYMKKIITQDQMKFISRMQRYSKSINQYDTTTLTK